MATKTCQLCGVFYRIKDSAASKSKFCSKVCHSKAKERKSVKFCVECGKSFSVPQCHYDRKHRCSRECIKIFKRRRMKMLMHTTDLLSRSRRGQAKRVHYDSNIVMRSGWEVTFAKWLDYCGLTWSYEPQLFDLGEFSYLPDFWVEEWQTYVEVKPSWRLEEARVKIDAFVATGLPLTVIGDEEISKMHNDMKLAKAV